MITDDTEIVSALRRALADRVGKDRFELWFGASASLEMVDGTLTVGAPNPFYQRWLQSAFRRDLERACVEVLGTCPELKFHVDPTLPEPPQGDAPAKIAAKTTEAKTDESSRAGLRVCRPDEPRRNNAETSGANGTRRRFAAPESFVTGPSNQLARVAADMVHKRPGQFSPLLIHGPTGVGKTHLLEGIWTAARKARPGGSAVYLSAEQFTTYFIEALRGSGLPSFRRKYRDVGLLIIDDLQFFRGKRSTLVELLYTIDTMLRGGRQLVFAADRPLAELAELGAELTSRLAAGMTCGIEPPEHATRLGIVTQMARRLQVKVPDDVLHLIASRLTNHARELSGALCRLQATSQALEQPIRLAMAEEALAEMIHHGSRTVRLPDIQKAVCDVFGLEPESLKSGSKGRRVSHPRMLAMWLARKHTRAALIEIGHFFGRRSHSTVLSAQKRVDRWLAAGEPIDLADRTAGIDEAIRRVERLLLAG